MSAAMTMRPVPDRRVQALCEALGGALDELKVFIPPPVQRIVARLTVGTRGMVGAHAPALTPPSAGCLT
jgi:hypothetical protein